MLPMQGAWVQSLVRELRSHTSCGSAKKVKKKKIKEEENEGEVQERPPGEATLS